MGTLSSVKNLIHHAVDTVFIKMNETGSDSEYFNDPERDMNIDDYDEWYYNRPQAKQYLENAKIWINLVDMITYLTPKRVFEFGSGLGQVLNECSKRGVNISGSETSEYAIKNSLCKEKTIRIGMIPQANLPFENNQFDLVFSSEVMEHVQKLHTDAVIKELYRICSKYALLTINTFDKTQPGHINIHSRKWWLNKFYKNGFIHDDIIWAELEKIKCLAWDVYIFRKKQ